jgi:osmotically-inducible protein OsmY
MRTPQLLCGVAAALTLVAGGCNRADTNAQTQRAAAEVRGAASKARDELADAWLTTQIQAKYFADRDIKARYIDVSTNNHVVTLDGYVQSDDARRHAVDLAKETNGVREVQDRLLIGQAPRTADRTLPADTAANPAATSPAPAAPAAPSNETAATTGQTSSAPADRPIDDARITTTIQAKYFVSATVKGRRIDVDTRGGVVTLRGQVASEREREEALRAARETAGVQRVEDMLTVDAGLK